MAKKDKKPILDQIFGRKKGNERRLFEIRPQSTTPTSGLRNLEKKRSISPPKSKQQEISWVDYEDLIKARQEKKEIVPLQSCSCSPSPISRTPSRGRSPTRNQSKKNQLEEDDGNDYGGKCNVRCSTSLYVQPKETLPFPFLKRSSQNSLLEEIGDKRRSSFKPFSLKCGENFQGKLYIEERHSIVSTPRVPGDDMWRDVINERPSIVQELDVEGLGMRIPQYLVDMRGESRRSSLHDLSTFGEFLTNQRRSAFIRSVMASTNIDGAQATQISNKYITIAPKARLSTVIVPINAKQWLLQIMCQKDLHLRELFDQMELVPQFAGDHIREVKAEWEAQEALQMPVPLEVETLIKDKTLIKRVKDLLVYFIEDLYNGPPELALMEEETKVNDMNEIKSSLKLQMEELHSIQSIEKKNSCNQSPSKMFQGFERDQEGNLSPIFGLGASICPLCGQIQKRSFGIDGQLLPPNPTKLVRLNGDTRKTYHSFNNKRWFIILFPALQPANKDKIELLGEWLRYATCQNGCEDYNGRFIDVGSAFILHSIAFMEVVRQVRLQCEERGDMLLHVWRQILCLFSQIMIRVEPKIIEMLKEISALKDTIYSNKQNISQISDELATITHNLEVFEVQLKEKELQWSQLKQCHFCIGDGRDRDYHEQMHLKGSPSLNKHKLDIGEDSKTREDGKFHQNGDQDNENGSLKGGTNIRDGISKLGGDQGISGSINGGSHGTLSRIGGVDTFFKGKHQNEDMESYKPGKISENYFHIDGLYVDVAVQIDQDTRGKNLFFSILERPISAPGRLITAIMEEFQLAGGVIHKDLADGEEPIIKKEPEVIGLTVADLAMLDATDDMAEEVEIGSINKQALKSLASDSLHILEKIPEDQIEEKMANSLFGLLGRFRNLKFSGQDGEKDDEEENKKKKSKWKKLQRGFEDQKKRGDTLVSVVQEMMAHQKKPPAKITKPKDLPNIPLGFSKMMKVNPPPKVVKLFNERQVVKLVDAIYLKKIEADAIDDAQGNERQNACEFMYDFMLNSYGLKGLAESAVHGVFKRIKQLMVKSIDKNHKLRLFQQFCGFDPLQGYGELDLYLYLKCLSRAQSKIGILFPTENEDGTFINTNPNQTDILLEEPTLLAQFKGSKEVAQDFLEKYAASNGSIEKVSNEVQKLVKSPIVRKLDFDLLMEAIIEVSPHKIDSKKAPKPKITSKATSVMTKEESASLETLFKAGDANQDGVLTFNEFREIINTTDSSISETKALRMFRETLLFMPDGGDSISPSAFAIVAYSNDIKATPAVIFDLLKKTWLQIQDDMNEEKIADKDNKKDCDDMQVALQNMLNERRPTDIFNAVQTFSTFVLRFCGEVEGTTEVLQEFEHEVETKADEEFND